MRLFFTDLLPSDLQAEDPCASLLETEALGPQGTEPVLLMDRRLAQEAAAAGRWEALAGLLKRAPSRLHLPLCLDHPEQTLALIQGLLARGAGAQGIQLLVPPGRSLELPAGVEPVALGEQARWRLKDYGRWERELLLQGLLLLEGSPPFLERPGRIYAGAEASLADWQRAIQAHRDRCRMAFGEDPPEQALRWRAAGTVWAEDRWRLRALVECCQSQGLRLSELRVTRCPADPEAARALLTRVLEELAWVEWLQPQQPPRLVWPGELPAPVPLSEGSREALSSLERLAQEGLGSTAWRRCADDLPRATAFRALRWQRGPEGHDPQLTERVRELLGPPEGWLRAYRRHLRNPRARLVLIPSWECELRCRYCSIAKTSGKEMSPAVLQQSLELLMSAPTRDLELAFFGGEPLLAWERLRPLCLQAHRQAQAEGRRLRLQFTTNGWSIQPELLDQLRGLDVFFQLSIDGAPETQNRQRPARDRGLDSYAHSPARKLAWFQERGLDHVGIMVVPPAEVQHMGRNFQHLLQLGFQKLQLNYAIGAPWKPADCQAFAQGLMEIRALLEAAWSRGEAVELVNLGETRKRVRNNLHVTVDWDGAIYGGNAFLVQSARREDFRLGQLEDCQSWHRLMADGDSDEEVFARWARRGSVAQNQQVGAVLMSWVGWMAEQHPERARAPGG